MTCYKCIIVRVYIGVFFIFHWFFGGLFYFARGNPAAGPLIQGFVLSCFNIWAKPRGAVSGASPVWADRVELAYNGLVCSCQGARVDPGP